MSEWERPEPLEKKTITDAIDELQESCADLNDRGIHNKCPDHPAMVRNAKANSAASVLSLRLQEATLYELQEVKKLMRVPAEPRIAQPSSVLGFLRFGKLQAGGLTAVVISLVVAVMVFAGIAKYVAGELEGLKAEIAKVEKKVEK